PIVASNKGAGPEIVQPGEGFVIEPDDPDGLAEVLIRLASDQTLRDEMGRAARIGARRFDISKTAEAVERVYEAL
ncbi:MAG: glycosyltransferase, partial [Actinomycetota bacterium]